MMRIYSFCDSQIEKYFLFHFIFNILCFMSSSFWMIYSLYLYFWLFSLFLPLQWPTLPATLKISVKISFHLFYKNDILFIRGRMKHTKSFTSCDKNFGYLFIFTLDTFYLLHLYNIQNLSLDHGHQKLCTWLSSMSMKILPSNKKANEHIYCFVKPLVSSQTVDFFEFVMYSSITILYISIM